MTSNAESTVATTQTLIRGMMAHSWSSLTFYIKFAKACANRLSCERKLQTGLCSGLPTTTDHEQKCQKAVITEAHAMCFSTFTSLLWQLSTCDLALSRDLTSTQAQVIRWTLEKHQSICHLSIFGKAAMTPMPPHK